uniref:Uncharacterized protein n=1 Tax=viral metagenome TaxID=1070528 RepID=A0A6C0AZ12_9ZZZZ|tara:strand:+ start:64373 stop:65053 length:681 start_codon:yes stop_codon:yes gene_type:complete
MTNKCPPGVICVENITLLFVIIIILCIIFFGYFSLSKFVNYKRIDSSEKYNTILNIQDRNIPTNQGLYSRPGYSFSNIKDDVLLNPYQAPLRDNRLFPNNDLNNMPNKMPINVPTQSYDTNYRQIGILTRVGDKESILPLMGRPLMSNRDKWNFYAMSENNLLKLPISTIKSSSTSSSGSNSYTKCMGENGCNDLYNGDIVKVDGYNDVFKVTTYENNAPQYIPYI